MLQLALGQLFDSDFKILLSPSLTSYSGFGRQGHSTLRWYKNVAIESKRREWCIVGGTGCNFSFSAMMVRRKGWRFLLPHRPG